MGIIRLPIVIVKNPQEATIYQCAQCPFFTTKIFQLKKHKEESNHLARGLTDDVKRAIIQVDDCSGDTVEGSLCFTDNSENEEITEKTRDEKEKTDVVQEKDKANEMEQQFPCTLCAKIFKSQSTLDTHVSARHLCPKRPCPECGKLFRKKQLYKHLHTVHSKLTFICDRCDFQCKDKTGLANHQLRKHAPKVLPCGECDAVFSNYISRKSHKRDKHSLDMFYCEFCNHKTSIKSSLDMHIKSKHTLKANFVCSFCPFESIDRVEIDNHRVKEHPLDEKMKKATKARIPKKVINYDCKVCGYKLNSRHSRQQHMKVKHGNISFPCDQCDYKTTTEGGLRRHVDSIHKRVKHPCEYCEFKASTPAALRRHEIFLHEDLVKVYACDKCNYRARNKILLQKHLISKDRRHP